MNGRIEIPLGRTQRIFLDERNNRIYNSLSEIGDLELNHDALGLFLKFGFVPGWLTLFKGVRTFPGGTIIELNGGGYKIVGRVKYEDFVEPGKYDNLEENKLIELGRQRFKEAIQASLHEAVQPIVIPLSGGLDSRALLAGVLEFCDGKDITTYTFGTPKTFDYEIGKQVAECVGVKNIEFDLTRIPFRLESLERTALLSDGNTDIFQPHALMAILDSLGQNAEYWQGFMGDPLVGGHYRNNPSKNWEEAIQYFSYNNTYCCSTFLTDISTEQIIEHLNWQIPPETNLSFDNFLDYYYRQEGYISHQLFMNGYNAKTPFLQGNWINFCLSIPWEYHENQALYKKILCRAYPELFSLPTKNNLGLPITSTRRQYRARWLKLKAQSGFRKFFPISSSPPPLTNYIDFNEGIRKRRDLREIIYENLQDLKKRKLMDMIKIDTIWQEHQYRKENHAAALTLLMSLEIILKAFSVKT